MKTKIAIAAMQAIGIGGIIFGVIYGISFLATDPAELSFTVIGKIRPMFAFSIVIGSIIIGIISEVMEQKHNKTNHHQDC